MLRTLVRWRAVDFTNADRTTWMSWAKVVAIAAVVLIHVTSANAVLAEAGQYGMGRAVIALNRGSLFAVPLFVMVSGALLLNPRRYGGPGHFLARRVGRLVPAIVFWHAFYFVFRTSVLGWDTGVVDYIALTLNGKAFTALYFFWIVLGLALVSPLLIPWIGAAPRRQVLVAGLALSLMPGLTLATAQLRARNELWIDTPWTWWVFYLGFYVLGWALRDIVLRGIGLAVGTLAFVGLGLFGAYSWYDDSLPSLMRSVLTAGYYNLMMIPYATLAFVLLHSYAVIAARRARLARAFNERRARILGDATLGVFALHLAVLSLATASGVFGDAKHATTWWELAARYVAVLIGTYGVVLVARRIPVVRRVV